MIHRELYPSLDPYQSGRLEVDDIHTLYWEACGNPQGLPVVFLHGGPGAGCNPTYRQFFDPEAWHIILFDQRGCGRSTPHGETRQNTTEHLVADMEKLRQHLNIEKWHIFGGSWGSTLALAYGQTFPDRCLGFILRGIYLMRQKETEWYTRGIRKIRPEAWQNFASLIPVEERGDIIAAYYRRLTDPDPAIRKEATHRMLTYEITCATMEPMLRPKLCSAEEAQFNVMPLMEAHYMVNNRPKPDSRYLDNVACLRHIPAIIIQGRYDLICPIETAYELHEQWPEAEFIVIEDAGHSTFEADIRTALLNATDKMKNVRS